MGLANLPEELQTYTPRPRELSDLVTQRPKAVTPQHSEGGIKGLRVTKSLSFLRL